MYFDGCKIELKWVSADRCGAKEGKSFHSSVLPLHVRGEEQNGFLELDQKASDYFRFFL